MARITSNSIMAPAIDRGMSLRRPVVLRRSRLRTLAFLVVIALLIGAAVYFYFNRWQGQSAANLIIKNEAPKDSRVSAKAAPTTEEKIAKTPSIFDSNRLELFEQETIDLSGSLANHRSAIAPDGNLFAICDANGVLTLVDFDGIGRRAVPLSAPVSALAFSVDGGFLACGLENGDIALINTKTAEIIEQRRVHRARVTSISYLADEDTILSAGADGFLRSISSRTLVERSRTAFGEPIVAAASSSESGLAWALGEDGAFRAYSLAAMREVASTFLPAGKSSIAVAANLGVVTFADGELSVRDPHSLRVLWSKRGFDAKAALSAHLDAVALSDPQGLFLVSNQDGEIVGRRIDLGAKVASLSLSKNLNHGLVIDDEGKAHGLRVG